VVQQYGAVHGQRVQGELPPATLFQPRQLYVRVCWVQPALTPRKHLPSCMPASHTPQRQLLDVAAPCSLPLSLCTGLP
jgi:hypothetical protein